MVSFDFMISRRPSDTWNEETTEGKKARTNRETSRAGHHFPPLLADNFSLLIKNIIIDCSSEKLPMRYAFSHPSGIAILGVRTDVEAHIFHILLFPSLLLTLPFILPFLRTLFIYYIDIYIYIIYIFFSSLIFPANLFR